MTDDGAFRIGSSSGTNLFALNGSDLKPLNIQTPQDMTLDDVREQLRATSGALAETVRSFNTQIVETKTGSVAASNADTVASTVSSLAEKLNDALSRLGQLKDAGQFRSDVEARIRTAIQSLSETGVQGLTVSAKAGEVRLSVDRAKLASALNSADGTLTAPLRLFAGRIAGIDGPQKSNLPRPPVSPFEIAEIIKAQDKMLAIANRTLGTMLFPAPSTKKALEAYREAPRDGRRS